MPIGLNWAELQDALEQKRALLLEIKENMTEQAELIASEQTELLIAKVSQRKSLLEKAMGIQIPKDFEDIVEVAPQQVMLLHDEITQLLNWIKVEDAHNTKNIEQKMKDIREAMLAISKEKRGVNAYYNSSTSGGAFFDKKN